LNGQRDWSVSRWWPPLFKNRKYGTSSV